MKLSLFICFVLCCATLVSTGPTWKKIQKKLKKAVKPYTDFVHVVSSHKDVTSNDFEEAKKAALFLTQGVDKLGGGIGSQNSRISFVQFSLSIYHEVYFGSWQNFQYIQNRINNIRLRTGNYAAVGNGLDGAKKQFNWYTSQNRKVVWLVTNRFSEIGADAKVVANQLKNSGATIFVVGIGQINRWKELQKLATSKGYAFNFTNYKEYRQAVADAYKKL